SSNDDILWVSEASPGRTGAARQRQRSYEMATETTTRIGTIKHNEREDRVSLYRVEGDPNVWAAADDEEPYRTDVPLDGVGTAWGDPVWDLQLDDLDGND